MKALNLVMIALSLGSMNARAEVLDAQSVDGNESIQVIRCYALDALNQYFEGKAPGSYEAGKIAQRNCLQNSQVAHTCRIVDCAAL